MPNQRYQTAKYATLVNACVNTALAFFKIIMGYWGHSHALIADGVHSFSDLLSDGLVLIAAKIGGKIPDKEHPYGHQRIETLAAIVIAISLFAVGFSIIFGTYQHIAHQKIQTILGIPVIIAALIAMAVKEGLYRYTLKIGNKIHSTLLITNAIHNRSDVWVSGLVVISAIGTLIGIPYSDNISAAIIALIIIKSGGQLFLLGIRELIDTGADEQTLKKIKECIQSTPGVVSIHQLRTRSHGGNIFVDSHILVNSFISVSEGHHIGEKVHENLVNTFPEIADVTVHIDPENDEIAKPSLNLPTRAEIIAQLQKHWQDLPGYNQIEKIDIHYLNGQIYLEVCWPPHCISENKWEEINRVYLENTQFLTHLAEIKFLARMK